MRKLLITSALALALVTGTADMAASKDFRGEWKAHFEEQLTKLPEDKRALVKESFEEGREAHKASREQMKALHEEVKAILLAPTFDKEAYLAKNKEITALRSSLHNQRAERLAELASKLTPEERKILVEMRGPHHMRGGPKGDVKEAPEPPADE